MILVVGALASGKRSYVRSLGYADCDMSPDLSEACPVVLGVEQLVKTYDGDIAELARRIASAKRVAVCTEIGSGIVPAGKDERAWRERAGRLSVELAARADAVVRLVCGIPQPVKGSLTKTGPLACHAFFANRDCKYFPCHEGVDENEFNCLFCYCPLYALGPDCGGNFTYTESGRKNCRKCILPHVGVNGVDLVAAHYEQLARLASDITSSDV